MGKNENSSANTFNNVGPAGNYANLDPGAKLLLTVRNAMSAAHLGRENRGLKRELDLAHEPVGKSALMEELRDQARRAAAHDAPVLITGESGSGKAALARYIHQHSARAGGEFVRLSVAALSHADGPAQLFGLENGDAVRYGALESANSGILFLEDIADLDLSLQARLVGALQHKRFQRVGGPRVLKPQPPRRS